MLIKKTTTLTLLSLLLLLGACKSSEDKYQKQAREIHTRILTLDSHTDTPLMFGREGFDLGKWNDPHQGGGKLDFPRMEEGGLDAAFFAVFLGQGESTPEGYEVARERANNTFNQIYQAIEQNKDIAGLALTPDDAYRLKKEGKRAVFIGLENAYPIGDELSMSNVYFDMGARYITLSHTRNNHISDSSTDPAGTLHDGLSEQGRELVRIMNQMGMMIDVSHISDKAFYDVLEISTLPVIASHSNTRAVNDDPRNLDDQMIKALAANEGVIQLCFLYVKKMAPNPPRDSARAEVRARYNNFEDLSDEQMNEAREAWREINRIYPPELPTVSDLIDHLDHVVKLVGIDHVGIGSDFDGGGDLKDCFDVSQMHNITAEMLRRGYTEEEIEKVWSGNFMRVIRENLAARDVN
jgi:membrane dipeptidase